MMQNISLLFFYIFVMSCIFLFTVLPPTAEVYPSLITVNEGEILVFNCNTSGNPRPSLEWRKMGSTAVVSTKSTFTINSTSRPPPRLTWPRPGEEILAVNGTSVKNSLYFNPIRVLMTLELMSVEELIAWERNCYPVR